MWRFGSLVFWCFRMDMMPLYTMLNYIDASLTKQAFIKRDGLKTSSWNPCCFFQLCHVKFTLWWTSQSVVFFSDSPAFPKPSKQKVWSNLMRCFNQHVSVSVMLLSGSGCCTRRSSAWEPQTIAGTSLETWIIRTKLVSRWIRVMSRWWCLVTMVCQKGIVCKGPVSFHLGFFQVGEIS